MDTLEWSGGRILVILEIPDERWAQQKLPRSCKAATWNRAICRYRLGSGQQNNYREVDDFKCVSIGISNSSSSSSSSSSRGSLRDYYTDS